MEVQETCEIPGTKTLYPGRQPLSSAFIIFHFGNAGVCCESWQLCFPKSHMASYRQLSHCPTAFICVFCLPFPRAGRCEPSLSGAASGTACLMEVSLSCFLISKVFQHLINLHVSLSRSDPIPALKSYCDAPAIT